MSKAQAVRELLAQKIAPKEIAEKTGATVQYVYDIRYKMYGPKRKIKKTTAVVDPKPDNRLDNMKRQIVHLETEVFMRDAVINALRNRLYAASV